MISLKRALRLRRYLKARRTAPIPADVLDRLELVGLEEDWTRFDGIIRRQHRKYEYDTDIRKLLDAIYLAPDRAKDFLRFQKSREFAALLRVLRIFEVAPTTKIVEVGGGAGFLAAAMVQSGFSNYTLFEPNSNFVTGTGYLRTREEGKSIKIFNDLHDWHTAGKRYEVVITKSCLHHFGNIAYVGASIRQRLEPGGLWFAEREWFAESPDELTGALLSHPYCQPFRTYEWPYPAHHYVEGLELVGMSLRAVIPSGYDNDCLGTYSEDCPTPEQQRFTEEFDLLLKTKPEQTVEAFWQEVKGNRFDGRSDRIYSRPPLLVFKKRLIEQ